MIRATMVAAVLSFTHLASVAVLARSMAPIAEARRPKPPPPTCSDCKQALERAMALVNDDCQ